jgi:hypothetical protein
MNFLVRIYFLNADIVEGKFDGYNLKVLAVPFVVVDLQAVFRVGVFIISIPCFVSLALVDH